MASRQNSRHSADIIFKLIFLNENYCALIQLTLVFFHKRVVDNKSVMIQTMTRCLFGTKPLSEPMMAEFTGAYASLGVDHLKLISP